MTGPRDSTHQVTGCCTWCGHTPHPGPCTGRIKVTAAPSGAPGRQAPTELVDCPCAHRKSHSRVTLTAANGSLHSDPIPVDNPRPGSEKGSLRQR